MQLESGLYQWKWKVHFYALVVIKNKATSFGSGSNQSHWEIQQTVSVSQEYFWCFERKGGVFCSVYILQNEFEGHVGEVLPVLSDQVLQFLSLLLCFVELDVVIIRNLDWNVHWSEIKLSINLLIQYLLIYWQIFWFEMIRIMTAHTHFQTFCLLRTWCILLVCMLYHFCMPMCGPLLPMNIFVESELVILADLLSGLLSRGVRGEHHVVV